MRPEKRIETFSYVVTYYFPLAQASGFGTRTTCHVAIDLTHLGYEKIFDSRTGRLDPH